MTTRGSTPSDDSGASPPDALVRFEGVSKAFSGHLVLDDIDLAFREGQTTVVLGPSGAGKSVLLKHIAGLLRPDEGRVWFRDQRVDRLPERRLTSIRRQIGFLFQLAALFDSMTVRENVEFPLVEHTSLGADERLEKVREALRRVDREGVEDKHPGQLSGGQRQRVGLARALVLEPCLILYDEPTTGLDPVRADGINSLILRLQRELGVTGIVVTHDLVSAERVADRLVLLHGGRIVADGRWEELQQHPSPVVSSFLAGREEELDKLDGAEEGSPEIAKEPAMSASGDGRTEGSD